MDGKSLMIFAIPYLFILTLVLSPMFAPLSITAMVFVVKGATDFLLAAPPLWTFGRRGLIYYFPIFEIYYILYVLLFPGIVLFATEVMWKERALKNGLSVKNKGLSQS